jgi:CIC family chloride channel protein
MWRRKSTMAVVASGGMVPHQSDVVGVITKEHVADSVAESIKPYAASDVLL